MLNTLIRLGEELNTNTQSNNIPLYEGNITTIDNNYVLELIFDLDTEEMIVSPQNLKEFDPKLIQKFKLLKTLSARNDKIYVSTLIDKIDHLSIALLGNENQVLGQLAGHIKKNYPQFTKTVFFEILSKISALKNQRVKLDKAYIERTCGLSKKDKLIFVTSSVKSNEYNINETKPLSAFNEYEEFLIQKFSQKEARSKDLTLCYASGKFEENVAVAEFTDRYSINKMFVKTTKNFLSNFEEDNLYKNYQISQKNSNYLATASAFILRNLTITIANVNHCIIPHFLTNSEINFEYSLKNVLKKNSELLFQLTKFDELVTSLENEINEPYWITYLAFESDGKSFKTINQIKDVSIFYLNKVLEISTFIDKYFRYQLNYAVNWENAMTVYDNRTKSIVNSKFNVDTIYRIIPIRKDQNKNEVLEIFKMIFENRPIQKIKVYKHFCNLILCHYYSRYNAFVNISPQKNLDFAIRDSVFKYFAFITLLKQLNLFNNMEENEQMLISSTVLPENFAQRIDTFFEQMGYNEQQRGMFYLGRVLNTVTYHIQEGKSKTVLDKINFNGIKWNAVHRLSTDLFDKARQYGELKQIIHNYSRFTSSFPANENDWELDAEEAVFFLLSGYSFGIGTKSK